MRHREGFRADADDRRIRKGGIWPGVLLASLMFTGDSPALDITLGADAKVVEEYNTNIFLTPLPHDEAWGQGVDGGLDLSVADERWGTRANARFNNRWFLPDSNLDYFNQLFSLKSYYLAERWRFGVDTQYNMDTSLTSQTDPISDLGFVFTRVPRTVRVISPSWLYNLTEKTQINLGYTYQDTTYDQDKNVGRFPDSEAHTGYLGLSHQLTEKLQLTGSAYYSDYALTSVESFASFTRPTFFGPLTNSQLIPSLTSTIRTASLMAGFDYDIDETFNIALSAGGQYNETATPAYDITYTQRFGNFPPSVSVLQIDGISNDSVSEIISAKASKRFETSDLSVGYDRSISPNIQGDLITYDNYSINGSHRFSSHLSTSLNLSYSDRTFPAAEGQTITSSSELFGARPAINWQWDENWLISGSYQFYYLSYRDTEQTATNHALYLNIQYLFDKQKL